MPDINNTSYELMFNKSVATITSGLCMTDKDTTNTEFLSETNNFASEFMSGIGNNGIGFMSDMDNGKLYLR